MPSTDRSGTSLGRYRLIRLIGRGGMGEVYEAVDTEKDRTVAVKLLPANLSDDDGFRARFLRESQSVAKLNDPHIIPIHDFGELDGQLFLDMRIVDGRDLRSVIAEGPLPAERAVGIVEQIAGALDTAHAAHLLHRDVKPENVLLDARDFAYLADFGLAQSLGQTRLTSTGTAIGSFAYMAPERFGADVELGPPSDVYALTCVLFECLTGAQPFASTSIEQIIAGHLSRPVPTTGTAFDAVLAAGMAKNPTERIQSAGALAAAARAALSGQAYPTAAPGALTHAPTALAPFPTVMPMSAPPRPPSRSRTPLIAGAVAAVVLIAGGVLAATLLGRSSEPDTVASAVSQPLVTVTETRAAPSAHDSTTTTPTVPSPTVPSQPTQAPARGAGDLGLPTPISTPACDGTTITVVYNAVTPGAYAAEIAAALAQHPGARYLRTDQSCSSLKQSQNGNPIYAVYLPGASLADTCATKAASAADAYTRRLDNTTPVGTELC